MVYLHKRIIKPAEGDRHGQADEQRHSTEKPSAIKSRRAKGRRVYHVCLTLLPKPRSSIALEDRVDAVQARQNQRQQDAGQRFSAV